jgi:Xaa-Pro aminopeptidase
MGSCLFFTGCGSLRDTDSFAFAVYWEQQQGSDFNDGTSLPQSVAERLDKILIHNALAVTKIHEMPTVPDVMVHSEEEEANEC